MAGLFRFLLAFNVVVFHLVPSRIVGHWGPFAVHSFFLLSGYLMTLVLQRTYGFSLAGGARFAVNRFLRLFPTYYCVCLLSLAVLAVYGAALTAYHPAIRVPDTIDSILANLLIVPIFRWPGVRLSPPTWSLAVELTCYALLWLGIARSPRLALLSLVGAVAYTAYLLATKASFPIRYGTVWAALLPFSLGAVSYFHRDRVLAWCDGRMRLAIVGLYFANLLSLPWWYRGDPFMGPLYVNTVLTCFVTPFALDVRLSAAWLRTLDDWAGRLTYPVFLAHYPIAFLMHHLLIGGPARSLAVCLATLPPLLFFSWLVCSYVEMPMEHWRRRVRTSTAPQVVSLPPEEVRKAA